ncbi:MAG: hypothetical protein ACYDIC_00790 [Desulfobaccales bacterium]
MKRLLALVPMIFVVACAYTYQPPTIVAPETSILFQRSKGALFKAAQQVLVAEGYQITNANEASGTISTAPRTLRLTPEQADCGTTMGLDYLKDNRTSTWVAFGVIVEEGKLSVRANIQGEYKPGQSGIQNITFSCVSRGSLEKSLMEKIVTAAGLK